MESMNRIQKIVVFQQKKRGENKIRGIRQYGKDQFDIEVISIESHLPPVIDYTDQYLPNTIKADLVLDFLVHPDLSHDLALMCQNKRIPVIASGKKIAVPGVITPSTWCTLSRQEGLGNYGELFGMPEFQVDIINGRIKRLDVLRGAPCGATRKAAKRMIGLSAQEALKRIGLDTQFFCTADPAHWDPIYQKSPVHVAGNIHTTALHRVLNPKE